MEKSPSPGVGQNAKDTPGGEAQKGKTKKEINIGGAAPNSRERPDKKKKEKEPWAGRKKGEKNRCR